MGRIAFSVDWITTIVLVYIGLFGLFLLLTIDQGLFVQQFIFFIIGLVLVFLFSRIDSAILWWFAPIGYGIALFLLAATYLFPEVRGAARWIFIGPYQFQPSEILKPVLLVAFARFITQYSPRNIKYLPLHLVVFLVPFLLVFKQPDLGTSLIYGAFWLAMMIAGGLPLSLLIGSVALFSVCIPLVWPLLETYQQARILTFVNPALDPGGAGYNAVQATIAVGSGQLFGRGLGMGTQSHLRFLPEFHTDFIFATLIEDLGFVGGILLLAGYFILLWRIISVYLKRFDHLFAFVYSFGIFGMILTQVFINIGMNIGIIPITGITLPFVSYGGSSIVSLGISVGLLWAFKRFRSGDTSVAIG